MPRRTDPETIIRAQVVLEEHDLSPDGRFAVVVRRFVHRDRYRSHLWIVPLEGAGRPFALTSGAVRDFQRNVGQEPDGIVGPDTLAAFDRLRPSLDSPSRAVVREAESLRALQAGLAGAVVAIDPAGSDAESFAVATTLADELGRLGAKPAVLRAEGEDPTPSDRARAANEVDADACVSIHVDRERVTMGPVCFSFGSASTHSPMGMRLAQLIVEELAAAFGTAGTTERLAATLLRETRMPAVQVEPAVHGELDPAAVARAIATGHGRFFVPGS